MWAEKFLLVSMGGRAEGLACADPVGRTPIGASGNFDLLFLQFLFKLVIKIVIYLGIYDLQTINITVTSEIFCSIVSNTFLITIGLL